MTVSTEKVPANFVPAASVFSQTDAFAFDIPPDIYGFQPYIRNSSILSNTLVLQFCKQFFG